MRPLADEDTNGTPRRRPRVVVTGVGAVCAGGLNADEFALSLREGRSGLRPVTGLNMSGYATSLGGEVTGFGSQDYLAGRNPRLTERRCVLFALAAADEAIRRAALDLGAIDRTRVGIVLGTLLAGLRNGEIFHEIWLKEGFGKASKRFLLFQLPHTPADAISARLGIKGPKSVVSTACASGGNAIGYGMDLIASGKADVMLVGGVDPFTRLCFTGFNSLGALAGGPCTPFSGGKGISIGEGAAILVLERSDIAEGRGAPILAEFLGYGLSADAYHPTAPEPTGSGMARAMAAALEAGGVAPREVDYINAHGTGTGENDAVETRAIKAVFGQAAQKIPVSSTKSQIGHTMGAAGALEAVASILAIVGQFVPPTIHFDRARPDCDLDYVPNASRRHAVSVVLSNSAGFGGANSALVLGRWQRHPPSREVTYLDNRVVITGMGVATCLGIGLEAFWDGAREGRCGLGPISSFDPSPYGCALAGEVPMAGLHRWVNPRNLRHLDPLSINAVACTRMALNDARLKISAENAQRIGVLFGTGAGPLDTVAAFNQDIVRAGPLQVKPFLFQNSVFNAAAGHVCQEFGIKGCTSTLIIGDASFNNCVAYAYEILKKGTMDGILAATADVFCEPLLAGFAKLGLASREACRPFDARRDGLSPSGAAAAFMLETLAHASERGARIYGEIKGYGMSSDGYRCAGCDPSGVDWSRAMTLAIEESGFEPGQIDYVAATATGLRVMDLAEANAIKKALGPAACHVPVSAIRSLVGHSGAAGPALALAASLLGMRDGLIPPTAGLESPDPQCDLALVRGAPLRRKIHSALVNSFAWGGSYVTLAIAGYSP